MTLRHIDTLKTHYLEDFKTYPSDYHIENETTWIGIKVAPNTGVILDIKWWHHSPNSDTAKKIELYSNKFIGSSYSESIQIEFEKACSRT